MANEKDVFELRPYTVERNFVIGPLDESGKRGVRLIIPEATAAGITRVLNEAFRLGYRAALMEKA